MPWNLLKKLSNADTSQRIGPENKKLPTLRWIMTFLALQMLTWERNIMRLEQVLRNACEQNCH